MNILEQLRRVLTFADQRGYRKRKRIGTVEWKHLLAIRDKLNGVKLPPLEQNYG